VNGSEREAELQQQTTKNFDPFGFAQAKTSKIDGMKKGTIMKRVITPR
jgi:hypothetical protein